MFEIDAYVDSLKSIAEPSRLRILRLLSEGDLTVSDLTTILGQSQPRVSRHLKLLLETGLINRWQEGAWALFRLSNSGDKAKLLKLILDGIDASDPMIVRDLERMAAVKEKRRSAAAKYFSENAGSWNKIRSLHVAEGDVEKALLEVAGKGPFNALLDIGTGTGRILELFAPYYRSAVGLDASREMLGVARANLEAANIANSEVRLGDIYNMPVQRNAYDLIVIHQVLHFLDDPATAIKEASMSLSPSGKLIVVDFAPHELDFLRTEHQHQRLGFNTEYVESLFTDSGLKPAAARALKTDKAENEPLTVMIWSAQDQRIEIASDGTDAKTHMENVA